MSFTGQKLLPKYAISISLTFIVFYSVCVTCVTACMWEAWLAGEATAVWTPLLRVCAPCVMLLCLRVEITVCWQPHSSPRDGSAARTSATGRSVLRRSKPTSSLEISWQVLATRQLLLSLSNSGYSVGKSCAKRTHLRTLGLGLVVAKAHWNYMAFLLWSQKIFTDKMDKENILHFLAFLSCILVHWDLFTGGQRQTESACLAIHCNI